MTTKLQNHNISSTFEDDDTQDSMDVHSLTMSKKNVTIRKPRIPNLLATTSATADADSVNEFEEETSQVESKRSTRGIKSLQGLRNQKNMSIQRRRRENRSTHGTCFDEPNSSSESQWRKDSFQFCPYMVFWKHPGSEAATTIDTQSAIDRVVGNEQWTITYK